MKILLAASEVLPYAKTGGLADVAGSLPVAISKLGHRVSIVMPRYLIDSIESLTEPLPHDLSVWGQPTATYVDRSAAVPTYFIEAPQYFARGRLYGEPDDAERFAFFSRAVVEFARSSSERYDVIHVNDWMTGLVPAYIKILCKNDPALAGVRTFFTIHNLSFQGLFGLDLLSKFGLPDWIYRTENGIEFYGQASTLKAGIVYSDAVSTVSPKYSREIQTPEFGERFDGLLRSRREDLFGILNGVDYDEWNPATDPYIAARYSATDLRGKAMCKRDLLQAFGLPGEPERPLIGCISRLSEQKGVDLILEAADRMLDRGVAFALLGSGGESYERALQGLRDRRPSQVGVYLGFSNELAHKIEAGADMFLMPSRFEPCGLNQMYSLRYGTVPIVRGVGGLEDTIQNFDPATRRGNGFKFYDYTPERLLEKIYEALLVYEDKDLWRAIVLNGMAGDFSWDASARRYVEVFDNLRQSRAAAIV